jgi:mono/diheme cytochrome c family protein
MHSLTLRAHAIIISAIGLALLNSCGDGEKQHRGIELMPDMFVHPGYKRQNGIEVHADQSSDGKEQQWPVVMPPVPGTVSRAGPTYQIAPGDFVSARKLVNPLAPTSEVLRQGQYAFNVYCVVCHGRDGNAANGYVAKFFSAIPSLTNTHVAGMPDGEIYHIITVGRSRMPSYAAQLRSEQRWAVIDYLRVLTRATLALSDLERTVKADEAAVAAKPDDPNAKLTRDQDQASLEQRKKDLADVQRVGDDSGASFKPLPDPRPEYEVPVWPSGDVQPTGQEQAK